MDWNKIGKLARAGLAAATEDLAQKSDDLRDAYRKELRRRSDHEIQNARQRADAGSLPSWKVELLYDEVRRRGL